MQAKNRFGKSGRTIGGRTIGGRTVLVFTHSSSARAV